MTGGLGAWARAALALTGALALAIAPAAAASSLPAGADVRAAHHGLGAEASAPLPAIERRTPQIGGKLEVGSPLVVWVGATSPSAVDVRYQWYVGGDRVPGATGKYLTPTAEHAGHRVSVRVQLAADGHETSVRWANGESVITLPSFTRKAPSIGGTLIAGTELRAWVGAVSPSGARVSYQWYVGGSKVSGATSKYYTYTADDAGQRVSLRVQLSKAGYATSVAWDTAWPCSIDDASSCCVVVNKRRPLDPTRYAPADLVHPAGVAGTATMRREAADAMSRMHAAAKAAGADFWLSSGYRSYATQSSLYAGYVSRSGRATADTFSARPGYSEHQTGWAADVTDGSGCTLKGCFGDRAAGRWVAAHGADYGFIVRYPEGEQSVTGYIYEPWHLRYVGVDIAVAMRSRGVTTLEDFFGLAPAPTY
ncbi:D-alanyl-D-alanine carboxypeptidase family protein [Demequina sp.]|uniref:D-alanyl-D-alanine carboxypeptidase family protein n=1 Tax=Demequina sp. TaxID=2050685 RepID=UPI0025CBC525|nr:D-alanyl-D-alanine carboxypeptidase family protein [Demequina sp.]